MNKQKSKFNFILYSLVIFLTIGFSLSLKSTTADDWQPATSNPPGDNVTVINTSDINQEKQGSLILNTAGNSWGLLVDQGDVGIGVTIPAAKLDVDGGVKLGNDSAICNSSKEGTIRYDSANDSMDFCNGGEWVSIDLECISNCPESDGCGTDICGDSCGICPADIYTSSNYCHNGDVVRDLTDYECNNGINTCEYIELIDPIEDCDGNGCSGGDCCSDPCVGYNCGKRTNECGIEKDCGDCPTGTTYSSNYCSGLKVYRDATYYQCIDNTCTLQTSSYFIVDCDDGYYNYRCSGGTCYACPSGYRNCDYNSTCECHTGTSNQYAYCTWLSCMTLGGGGWWFSSH